MRDLQKALDKCVAEGRTIMELTDYNDIDAVRAAKAKLDKLAAKVERISRSIAVREQAHNILVKGGL